jgi:hypothetical protein
MPYMARTLSAVIDDELVALIEADRSRLSDSAGLNLSMSQYLRYVLQNQLNSRKDKDSFEIGWAEGMKQGYARFKREMNNFAKQFMNDAMTPEDMNSDVE